MILHQVELREKYKLETNINAKKSISKQQWDLWTKYQNERALEQPSELIFTESMKQNLLQIFMLYKKKGEVGVEPKSILEVQYKYAQMFKFQIPIEPLYLYQMFHPHVGYMVNLPRRIEFEELLEFFRINIVATYEYLLGQSMQGSELSSMTYWKFILEDPEQGWMDLDSFCRFLNIFKLGFEVQNKKDLKNNFRFLQEEEEQEQDNDFIPFEFYRLVFLERNL